MGVQGWELVIVEKLTERDQSSRSRVHKKCLTLAPRIPYNPKIVGFIYGILIKAQGFLIRFLHLCSSMHRNAALLIAAKLYTQMGKVALNIQASLNCCEMVRGIRLG